MLKILKTKIIFSFSELRTKFDELKSQVQVKNNEYEVERKVALTEQEKIGAIETACKRLMVRHDRCQNQIVQLETGIREKDENPDHVLNLKRANDKKLEDLTEKKVCLVSVLENAHRDMQLMASSVDNEREKIGSCMGKKSQLDQKFSEFSSFFN